MNFAASKDGSSEEYIGWVDYVDNNKVGGWVLARSNKRQPIRVGLVMSGQIVSRASADEFREDVSEEGKQGARVGFYLQYTGGPKSLISKGAKVVVLGKSDDWQVALPWYRTATLTLDVLQMRYQADHKPYEELEPVFVLGPARSGTSILQAAISVALDYSGFPEGHVLPLAKVFLEAMAGYYSINKDRRCEQTMLAAIDEEYWREAIADMFRQTFRLAFEGRLWLDKTPSLEMIQLAPFILHCWPRAKFVFAKRRGIENIESRRRKFPSVPFRDHCLNWNACMHSWREARGELGDRYAEVDQFDTANCPKRVAQQLHEFIRFSETRLERVESTLRSMHPEQTSGSPGAALSLESASWTIEERRLFVEICGEEMAHYGYTFDDRYAL